MLVFQLNKQFQHHWGVSALFRWFPLKTQARRNACRLEQQLMQVKSVFRSLLFWFITLCWRKRTWLGTGRGFAAFTAIAMGSAAAGLWLEFTWLSGSTGENEQWCQELAVGVWSCSLHVHETQKEFWFWFVFKLLIARVGSLFLGHGHAVCGLFLADFP